VWSLDKKALQFLKGERGEHKDEERAIVQYECEANAGKASLAWVRAKDHISRIVTRAVKKASEAREREIWAERQIAFVLDYVQPETAMKLVFRVTRRMGKSVTHLSKSLETFLLHTNEGPKQR
jgi:hypothetical protein